MSAAIDQRMSVEEFERLPDNGKQLDLVHGEVRETMPPGGEHGGLVAKVAVRLQLWTERGVGGYVGVESGFVLARNPDTVRGPDVYYVRAERMPSSGVPRNFWNIAPDLDVEVVSPGETADEVRDKVRDYLHAGTPLVWVVYPRSREVVVHTPDGLARAYSGDDRLEDAAVLPGFSCPLADLFG